MTVVFDHASGSSSGRGPTATSDLDRLFDTYSRWEVARWLGRDAQGPRSRATRRRPWSTGGRPAASRTRASASGRSQVRDTGVVAGTVLLVRCRLRLRTRADAEVEVGWHLHPDSWGHGYATEAGRGAIAHGFDGGLDEIYAVVRPDNERSLAVCRRLGMAPLGRTTRWYGTELEAFRITRPAHP